MRVENILLGITGGIAAYKSAEFVRLLRKNGFNVRVVMTAAAKEFVTPLTFQTLSGNTVYSELFDQNIETDPEHISLARWAHTVVIAPATANFLAKLATGLCDDLLSTLCLAAQVPMIVAPAMNHAMWTHVMTQHNVSILKSRGVQIVGPDEGELACTEVGKGRLVELTKLLSAVQNLNTEPILRGKKWLITAGPTREAIDPVRCLTNHSSGKMGYALAEAATKLGAEVTLVSGPTSLECPKNVHRIDVVSAQNMLDAVSKNTASVDVFVGVAAVADYRPDAISKEKIKKTKEGFTLHLVKNPDILATVAQLKNRPYVVGFAAETDPKKWLDYAKNKLHKKRLDMVVANLVGENCGFGNCDHTVTILTKDEVIALEKQPKFELAKRIVDEVAKRSRY